MNLPAQRDTPSYADLHLHSNYSDGSDSPERVVERAGALGFAMIALTDHDTLAGLGEAERAAEFHGVGFLPGVEISSQFQGTEVHVVGLGVNAGFGPLMAALAEVRRQRHERAVRIAAKLAKLGIEIDLAHLRSETQDLTLGRIHIARAIYAQGRCRTVQDAFDKYIGKDRPAYVPKAMLPIEESIYLIHGSGGLAFLGHPGIGHTLEKRLHVVLQLSFDGIEVYHTHHTAAQVSLFTMAALENDLLISGGSDCHGTAKEEAPEMGRVRIPYCHVERICQRLGRPAAGRPKRA